MGVVGRIVPFPSGNAKNTGLRIEISEHSRAVSLSFRSDSALARAWGPVSRAPERQVPQIAAKLQGQMRGNGVLAGSVRESVANSGNMTSLPVVLSPGGLKQHPMSRKGQEFKATAETSIYKYMRPNSFPGPLIRVQNRMACVALLRGSRGKSPLAPGNRRKHGPSIRK